MNKKRGRAARCIYGCIRRCRKLVGLFILYKFQQFNKINNFGLYRDDGLAQVKIMSGPLSEKVKKELQVLFKEIGLDLIIESNETTVDYLDITLD